MPTSPVSSDPQALRLPDSRQLAWYECGDPAGQPCFYSPGTPSSGIAGLAYDEPAHRAGLRWISVDRPGYGHSDYQPGRRLLDYPGDVEALADHLGLASFVSVGESGGGPHALALAAALPRRLVAAVIIAGMGPWDKGWARAGMKRDNRILMALARLAPWLLQIPLARQAKYLLDPESARAFVQRQLTAAPRADRAALELHSELLGIGVAAAADAYRCGARGAAQELALLARPWGFRPEDIRCRVELWHGAADASVPVGVARSLAQVIPNCGLHVVDGAGHGVVIGRADEILRSLAANRITV